MFINQIETSSISADPYLVFCILIYTVHTVVAQTVFVGRRVFVMFYCIGFINL